MSILSQVTCTPIHEGELPVSDEEIAELHPLVPAWEIVVDSGVRKLRNTFTFDEEKTAGAFVRYVEELARRENHHPVLDRQEGKVTVAWWTHTLSDLHPNDFIMAGKTDGAYTLAVVGAEGDMFTGEKLPTLAELPRFQEAFASRGPKKRAAK